MNGEKVLVEAYILDDDINIRNDGKVWIQIGDITALCSKDDIIHLETGEFPDIMKSIVNRME